ncbi:hypothetical protein BDQ17DRAFT_1376252 [Cyathus striatus]|nr:hypothetical protein BDQ17DRAFT_1376252 [Cyathus striatus]
MLLSFQLVFSPSSCHAHFYIIFKLTENKCGLGGHLTGCCCILNDLAKRYVKNCSTEHFCRVSFTVMLQIYNM